MTADQRSDSELLAALPRQPQRLGELYERHAPAVFRYLARRAGPAAAEDLLSEVFTAALDARKRVVAHPSGSALPWLYGIAMNVLRHYFRHSRGLGGGTRPGRGLGRRRRPPRRGGAAQAAPRRAVRLSEPDRELLLLVAWEGLTSAEAAEALGISKVAARSRLHRARHRALQALDQRRRPVRTHQPQPPGKKHHELSRRPAVRDRPRSRHHPRGPRQRPRRPRLRDRHPQRGPASGPRAAAPPRPAAAQAPLLIAASVAAAAAIAAGTTVSVLSSHSSEPQAAGGGASPNAGVNAHGRRRPPRRRQGRGRAARRLAGRRLLAGRPRATSAPARSTTATSGSPTTATASWRTTASPAP